jgi:transcriptional regulator with PAS, ATPase and Fis domain
MDRDVGPSRKVAQNLAAGRSPLTLPPPDRRAAPSVRATALVFEDPASKALLEELERIAPSEASVLIVGETGTGKELAARFVHNHSQRTDGPFIAVNCGAFVDTLVEAELFGFEKGAFTGATQARMGWFEAANAGTLFLDEIGDLPLMLQVKLLRVLQEREVVRLGSRQPIPIDVRVIAATNIDLQDAVAAGRFREDLFFRLNVASVSLPALRDRPGDILALARYFRDSYGARLERRLTFSPAAEQALLHHGWPGNIRELENVVHYALLIARGAAIEVPDLRFARSSAASRRRVTLEDDVRQVLQHYLASAEPNVFDRVTQLVIRTAFDAAGGNQVRAAEQLGISRNVLRTHLAKLGLVPPRQNG